MPDHPGSACHYCGAAAELQWPRHATSEEAAAHWDALERNIRESGNPGYIQDRTSPVHKPVYGCGDHALPMPCTHPERQPVPCPVCHATPGTPCTTPDGTVRAIDHRERGHAQPAPATCRHAHDADCGGYGACHCGTTRARPKSRTKAR
jgi:hypothetical protein